MNGAALTPEAIDAIAQLPSRDVLYGRLVGMVASPLTGLASAMGGLDRRARPPAAGDGRSGPRRRRRPAPAAPEADASAEAPAEETPAAEADTTSTESETQEDN